MARESINFILDGDSRFQDQQRQQQQQTQDNMSAPPPPTGGAAPEGGSEPTPPLEGSGPPDIPPPPQGGGGGRPTPPPTPGPTGGAQGVMGQSAVAGIGASDTTGGVQGSFGQAGTADFARRFGSTGQDSPATWFRRQSVLPGQGFEESRRRVLAGAGGQTAGGQGQSAADVAAQSQAGGTPQDEEWQRFMQAVIQQRFGVGGRR